ncbi:MAG: hybrid sensor histidine kinase/response regulator [Bacteroidaceae bacterium]
MNKKEDKKFKILIVDDQQKNIQVLGSLLRQEDYIIGVATNGQQALDALMKSNDYDLVLLDVNMPVMNGFEACKAIRQQEHLKEIPIIFLTALIESDSIVTGFDAGGQDYVTKPFNSKELLSRVRTHLELKDSKDQLKQVNEWLEKKVAERTKELELANKELLELDTAKSEFLNIISHEIKTPLNGIVGLFSIINELDVPEEVTELLNVMEESTLRLENFSNKALYISLFNTKGKSALRFNESDLNETMSAIVMRSKQQLEQKNMTAVLTNKMTDSSLSFDAVFMDRCFSYIMENAIRFGNPGSQVLITIVSSKDGGVVTIEDEGESLPADYDISKIKPFSTKLHVDDNPSLSLFLCKQIVEAHNGQLAISNTEKGVVVTVTLPMA